MDERIVRMPYGRGYVNLKIPKENLHEFSIPKEPYGLIDEKKEIEAALRNPIKKPPLHTLVDSQDKLVIIIDDITRPTPSSKMIRAILKEVHVPNKNVTIIVATGLHRKNTENELKAMVGNDILNKIRVVNHDAFDKNRLVYVGETSRGTKLEINKLVIDADVVITTGHIEPHEFAGFTGGRKSILPGVASVKSITYNHRLENLDHPRAKIGILEGNPIHEDMVEAAKMVGVDFMMNVILNSRKEITKVVAGDLIEAHVKGVDFYKKYYQVENSEPADIVIVSSGYPWDVDFYQSIKLIISAEPFVKKGGIIILLAACEAGFGTRLFYKWMTSFSSIDDIMNKIKIQGYRADLDHCYLLGRILKKNDVIVVSSHPSVQKVKKSILEVTTSPDKAVATALSRKGEDATILTLPYAQRLVPKY